MEPYKLKPKTQKDDKYKITKKEQVVINGQPIEKLGKKVRITNKAVRDFNAKRGHFAPKKKV